MVLSLVDALGFDAVDAGTLAESWRQQPGTPVYGTDLDASGVREALAADSAVMFAKACELGLGGLASKRQGGLFKTGEAATGRRQ